MMLRLLITVPFSFLTCVYVCLNTYNVRLSIIWSPRSLVISGLASKW